MGYGSYTQLVLYGELPTRQESGASHLERWSMEASSFTRGLLARADFRDWVWWKLPWLLRGDLGRRHPQGRLRPRRDHPGLHHRLGAAHRDLAAALLRHGHAHPAVC